MRPLSALVLLAALIPLFSAPHAHGCGLKQTSIRRLVQTPDNHNHLHLSIPTALRAATFQLKQGQGHYIESLTGVEYSPLPQLTLSAEASWVSLTVGSSHYSSLGNPRLSLEYTPLTLSWFNATVGGRVEIPTAAASRRIAASHLEVVPYTRLQWNRSAYHLTLQLGASVGVELPEAASEDDHRAHPDAPHPGATAGSMQFVNPHTDRELLFQVRGGRRWLGDTLESSVFLDGQTVLADSDPGATFVSAGLHLSARWGDHLLLSLDAERSVTTQQRFTWRTGLGLTMIL